MFEIVTDYFEKKRSQAHELELKKALSEKFSNYDDNHVTSDGDCSDKTDYTEITIGSKRMRVKKENITIFDISGYTLNSHNV